MSYMRRPRYNNDDDNDREDGNEDARTRPNPYNSLDGFNQRVRPRNGAGTVVRRYGPRNQCRVSIETRGGNYGGRDDDWSLRPIVQGNLRMGDVPLGRSRRSTSEDYVRPPPALRSDWRERSRSRTRPYERPLSPVPASSPFQSSGDDEEEAQDLDFDLSGFTEPATYVETAPIIIVDAPPSTDGNLRSYRQSFSGPLDDMQILQSHWLGNTYDRGELAGEITIPAASSTISSEKSITPIMRWVHLERRMMSFEEFMSAAESVLPAHQNISRAAIRLLRDTQRKHEQQRQNGRDMQPHFSSDTFFTDSRGGAASSRETAAVKFFAIPYHCLASYDTAQTRALGPGSPLHPLRPMLEAYFSSTTDKRELEQAATMMPHAEAQECLHVSQVWCLIANDQTVVTCSRMAFSQTSGESIRRSAVRVAHSDSQVAATDGPQPSWYVLRPQIKVTGFNQQSWLVPVSSSTTWPAFLSVFEEILAMSSQDLGESARLEGAQGVVTGELWPQIVEAAMGMLVELRLTIALPSSSDKDRPRSRSYNVDNQLRRRDNDGAGMEMFFSKPEATMQDDHLKQLCQKQGLQMFCREKDAGDAKFHADRLHEVLISNTRANERVGYTNCRAASAADVRDWLDRHEMADIESRPDRKLLKYKRKYALATTYCFRAFWSLDFTHSMVDKFWGAVLQTLTCQDGFFPGPDHDRMLDYRVAMEIGKTMHADLFEPVYGLTKEFSSYENDLQPLPQQFSKSWIHFLTSVVLIAQTPFTPAVASPEHLISKHLSGSSQNWTDGVHAISSRLRPASLEDAEICNATSLAALIAGHVLRDVTGKRPDVETTYTRYYQSLEFAIVTNPAPRSHQEKLRFFLQEIEAVLATLQSQRSVLDLLWESLAVEDSISAKVIEDLEESRQAVSLERIRASLASRISNFDGLQSRAQDLGEWHRNQLDLNKDRQEQAILIFTIITIIFLPLSFVSSVFGMNTADIRNTNLNQWSYWAAALPITFVVVVGSLWWAGVFDGLGTWLWNMMAIRRSRSRQGFVQLLDTSEQVQPIRSTRQEPMVEEVVPSSSSSPAKKGSFYPHMRRHTRRRRGSRVFDSTTV